MMKSKIKNSIKNGSKANWKNSNGAIMPSFKELNNEDLETLTEWILNIQT